MTSFVFVCAFAFVALIAGTMAVFSPTKAVLAVSSVALSLSLAVLGLFSASMHAIFWVAPSYFMLDTVVLYFIFATGLREGEARELRPQKKLFLAGALSLVLFLFSLVGWELWQSPPDQPMSSADTMTSMHLLLWEANRPIVILCFLLLAPAAIGALLMVRRRN